MVEVADDEIRFVRWGEGGLRRNQGESGSSGLVKAYNMLSVFFEK